jgi:hypothetical protein
MYILEKARTIETSAFSEAARTKTHKDTDNFLVTVGDVP